MTDVNLFIVPPASPHTVAAAVPYLAGHLDAQGHRVRIVDLNARLVHDSVSPAIVGRLTSRVTSAAEIAEVARAEGSVAQLCAAALGTSGTGADATWGDVELRAAALTDRAVGLMVDVVVHQLSEFPGLVGFSCLSQDQLAVALRVARGVKGIDPTATVVAGGPMLTTCSKYFPDQPPLDAFDYIVANNGAAAFDELLSSLDREESVSSDAVVHHGQTEVSVTVKAIGLPFGRPAPPLFPADLLAGLLTPTPVLPVYSAQGCSYGECNFCSSQRSVTPYRPTLMRWIVEEMDRLHREVGASTFDIVDNNFDPKRMGALVRALDDGDRHYRWKATARFYEEFDEGFFVRAVEAGCGLLCLGLESYDDAALAAMQKGYSTGTIDRVLEAARRARLPVHLYAIVGHPSETDGGRAATLAYLRDHQDCFASVYLQVYDANLSAGVFVSSTGEDLSSLASSVAELTDELADHFPDCDLHGDEGGVLVRRRGYPRSEELFLLSLIDAMAQ